MNFYDHVFFGDNAQLVKWLKTKGKPKETPTMNDYTFDAYVDHLLKLVNAKPASKKCFKHKLFESAMDRIMTQGYVLKTNSSEEFIVTEDQTGLRNGDHVYDGIAITSTGMIVDGYRNDICSIEEIKYISPIYTMTQDDLERLGLGSVQVNDNVMLFLNDVVIRIFNSLIDGATNLFSGELKKYADREVEVKGLLVCSRITENSDKFQKSVLDKIRMTDYILAEFVEIAGRAAENKGERVIDLHTMHMAIKDDESLDEFQRNLFDNYIMGADVSRF